ncbi:hypothetical protein F5Y10DRAFT_256699 [Nemania abortiva]|nr:hypothetical protein F5Y10DRAFT_256699 [Nemania abortiva]
MRCSDRFQSAPSWHYQPRTPIKFMSFDAACRPVTVQLGRVMPLGTLDRHSPDSQSFSNQPNAKSSAHQIVGFPSTSALTVMEVRSLKPETETRVNAQFSIFEQAGTLATCEATSTLPAFNRSYLNPVKVNEQDDSFESQPRLTRVKLNEKQPASLWGPTLISAVSGAIPGWELLEIDEGVNWSIRLPEAGLKRAAGGGRTVNPPE